MRNKFLLIGGLLLVTLALFGCASPAVAPSQVDEAPPRTISVTGSSKVFLEPDIAYISIGVRTRGSEVGQVVADNNALVAQVTAALRDVGIADEDMRTTDFNLYFYDQYGPNGETLGVTYEVSNTVYVTMRDISQVGVILEKAVNAGANSIYGIQFDVEDRSEFLPEARQAAIENAKSQAEEIASIAGVELGEIVSINFYGGQFPTAVNEVPAGRGMGGGGGEPYISGGQLSFTVEVNIVYEIK